MHPFGEAVRSLGAVHVEHPSSLAPAGDMNRVRQTLSGLTQESPASLRVYRPRPTAAFSPRDTVHLAYGEVTKNLVARGFTPAERGAGGQLAVYDEAALVIDLVAPHPQPRENTRDRFRLFADMLAAALRHIGVDARVGAVPGEYCPGDFSVNAGGTVKLAGLAQRVVKHGYHMGAVLSVGRSDAAREAVAEAYALMNIPFDPATFGSVAGCLGKMPTTVYTDIASAISVQLRQSQR